MKSLINFDKQSNIKTLDKKQLLTINGGEASAVSNVLKTKHDTVKNSISN